ncbi:MAG: hypothetical protein WKG07_09095 [Hymenobacter sp.]
MDEAVRPQQTRRRSFIYDRAPLFGGIAQTKIVPGAHLRGALSFEYGRYRDAVAGLEAGLSGGGAIPNDLLMLNPPAPADVNSLNHQFFPSVYLTLYIGHRN